MPAIANGTILNETLLIYLHNDDTFDSNRRWTLLNQSQHRIVRDAPWVLGGKEPASAIATVADTQEYSLADDFYQMLSIWNKTQGRIITPFNATEWRDYVESRSTISTGAPRYYRITHFDETSDVWKIRLYPTPDAVYSVDYFYYWQPTAISSSEMGPICALGFDELILWGAVMIAREVNDPEGHMLAKTNYQELLREYRNYGPMKPDYTYELRNQVQSSARTPGILPQDHYTNY